MFSSSAMDSNGRAASSNAGRKFAFVPFGVLDYCAGFCFSGFSFFFICSSESSG
jgi:hypothetical protein